MAQKGRLKMTLEQTNKINPHLKKCPFFAAHLKRLTLCGEVTSMRKKDKLNDWYMDLAYNCLQGGE